VLYKIPADPTGLPEGGTEGALEGKNDFGGRGYSGWMPPEVMVSITTISRYTP